MEEINQILSSNGRRLSKTSISRRSITSRGSISALSTLSVYKFNIEYSKRYSYYIIRKWSK